MCIRDSLSLPVKAKHIITPKQITTPKNELVFDLGQNITGSVSYTHLDVYKRQTPTIPPLVV